MLEFAGIRDMETPRGGIAKNQKVYVFRDEASNERIEFFESYGKIIGYIVMSINGITEPFYAMNEHFLNSTKTTGKYRNIFFDMDKRTLLNYIKYDYMKLLSYEEVYGVFNEVCERASTPQFRKYY